MRKPSVTPGLAEFGALPPASERKLDLAPAMANRLRGRDLLVVDTRTVAGKDIGETEKNLQRLFEAAAATGAALLFDEGEALFGQRSNVRDAHDRYANIDVTRLIDLAEANGGVAILTTNRKANLDSGFLRRLRVVIEFPKPK
jgi:SpoVK/Ycf46/Vps4 family AAA+-type ATPase